MVPLNTTKVSVISEEPTVDALICTSVLLPVLGESESVIANEILESMRYSLGAIKKSQSAITTVS